MARNYEKTGSSKLNRILRIVLVVLIVVLALFYVKSLLTPPDEPVEPVGTDDPVTVVIPSGNDADGESGETGAPNGETNGGGQAGEGTAPDPAPAIDENGEYNSKDDVALYLHTYGHLPSNYITKKEAQALGWEGGSLEPYAPGKSIGGDRFGNYEGILPKGKSYTECDIGTKGKKSRGAKRIVFSSDGLIYYTDDHYETFELLYGEE